MDDGTEALHAGSLDFENAIRDAEPMERIARDASDVYMLYAGGTTGMPTLFRCVRAEPVQTLRSG